MSLNFGLLFGLCTVLITAGIQIAMVFVTKRLPSKIMDYLLVDAWDIENCAALQRALWLTFMTRVSGSNDSWKSGDLDVSLHLSRRISALGQVVYAELIYNIVRASSYHTYLSLPESILADLFKYLINQGADIECRDTFRMETALLVAAEKDSIGRSTLIPVLLRFDADYSAVDYKGRGPLHLALKPSRRDLSFDERLNPQGLKDKLVRLLQAGCSIHAVDKYGRTPTDVARKWERTKAWKAALQEVGKLECEKSECQCVRLSPCLHLHYSVLALADNCLRENISSPALEIPGNPVPLSPKSQKSIGSMPASMMRTTINSLRVV